MKKMLVLLLVVMSVGVAYAEDRYFIWSGYNSSSWWDASNWLVNGATASAEPNTTEDYYAFAKIGQDLYISPLVITANPDPNYQTRLIDIYFGGGADEDPMIVTINDCNIWCQGSFRQNWGDGTQSSIINMTGGYIETLNGAFMLNCDGRSYYCKAVFNMSGGHLKVNSNWFNTFQEETKPGITDVNVSGTAQIDTRGLFIGERGQSTMTVSGNAVINCDELFIKGYNASYNGLVAPELIVNSSLPITTPCITVNNTLSLHQDAGGDLAKSTGAGTLTINSGCVKDLDAFRFGNVGEATLNMTGGKLDITGDIQCGINNSNGNSGYAVTAYLSGGQLWANNIVDYGNATINIYLSGNAAIYLSNPGSSFENDFINGGLISASESGQKIWVIDQLQGIKIIAASEDGVPYATDLYPASSTTDVRPDVVLSWTAGVGVTSHDVYFGTDATAVADANTESPEFQGTQSATTFDPLGSGQEGWLTNGQQYYWRVDEGSYKGDVVTFTVVTCDDASTGDLNGDCKTDFSDFAIMTEYWLEYSWQ